MDEEKNKEELKKISEEELKKISEEEVKKEETISEDETTKDEVEEEKVEKEINSINEEIKNEESRRNLIIIVILITIILILIGIIGFIIYNNYNGTEVEPKTEPKNNVQPVVIQQIDGFHTISTMQEIYYDPVNNVVCKYYQKGNSTIGNKTGCMRWYVFLDKANSEKVKLILDHNVVSNIQWYENNKNVPLSESNLPEYLDKLVTEDKWQVKPRLISANEVVQIIGYEQNEMRVIDDVRKIQSQPEGADFIIYLDSKINTKKPDLYNKSNYAWLYDYTKDCTMHGCNSEEETTSGYWTSTDTVFGNSIWAVTNEGVLKTVSSNTIDLGIRPVLEVDRNVINGELQKEKEESESSKYKSTYNYLENPLIDFDLSFLKLENTDTNKVYSPISIKFGLNMLSDFATNTTKEQIDIYLKNYNIKKYANNKNMAFANALFVRDTFKDKINSMIDSNLFWKYNANVKTDTFENADTINNWVSENTYNLITNVVDTLNDTDFALINTVAIDMDWVNKISYKAMFVNYEHEKYYKNVYDLEASGYREVEFGDSKKKISAIEIGAAINKYDIINELGEDNIRKTVSDAYSAWLETEEGQSTASWWSPMPTASEYVETYMKEIKENYKQIDSSTDFYFYVDDDVKVFAKDLKEYNGIKLQYVGIMPNELSLNDFIIEINAEKLTNYINSLKTVSLNNFKDGVITEIKGFIPIFNFDYELNVMDDLKALGITDVFDISKADLSNLTESQVAINKMIQKAKIDFSNEGIKAAAVNFGGGYGGGDFPFDYLYDVPVEEIDLTFDKPYLFLIRDKNTNEVWFAGTVYEPTEYIKRFDWE